MEPAREKAADMLRRNSGRPPPAESRLPLRLPAGRAIRCVTSHGAASVTLSPRKRGLRRADALGVRDALRCPPVLSADGGKSSTVDEKGHSHDDPSRRSIVVTYKNSALQRINFMHLWNNRYRNQLVHFQPRTGLVFCEGRDQLPQTSRSLMSGLDITTKGLSTVRAAADNGRGGRPGTCASRHGLSM